MQVGFRAGKSRRLPVAADRAAQMVKVDIGKQHRRFAGEIAGQRKAGVFGDHQRGPQQQIFPRLVRQGEPRFLRRDLGQSGVLVGLVIFARVQRRPDRQVGPGQGAADHLHRAHGLERAVPQQTALQRHENETIIGDLVVWPEGFAPAVAKTV